MTRLIRWTLWERIQRSERKHGRLAKIGLDRDFLTAILLAAAMLALWWFIMGPDRMSH
jgi:hypothetical protein